MKSPFRIRVQSPSGEFEVFEDDPTKVAEKVRELEKLHGRTATIVDADGKPVDRTSDDRNSEFHATLEFDL